MTSIYLTKSTEIFTVLPVWDIPVPFDSCPDAANCKYGDEPICSEWWEVLCGGVRGDASEWPAVRKIIE